jgi:DNA-binding winged helix-turn-helix (wHTH) protein
MTSDCFHFKGFVLDPRNRLLRYGDAPVDLNGRYLDALILLVRERGGLVSKDRFFAEIWRGVPVTDEALTQCIRTLRRQLGDNAASPRFIETVPKHGYRFIAPIDRIDVAAVDRPRTAAVRHPDRRWLVLGGAGTLGGGIAGVLGGLFYGLVGASQPAHGGVGAISMLLVLTSLTTLVALLGGAGVSFGIAAGTTLTSRWHGSAAGGALGGLVVGAATKLIGLDAFNLMFGRSPGEITGAGEGLLLGAAIGLSAWLSDRAAAAGSHRRGVAVALLVSGVAGMIIVLLGGQMMSGSLDLLARHFPESHLRLDRLGSLFGEAGLGPITRVMTSALEGSLFGGCIVQAMMLVRQQRPGG